MSRISSLVHPNFAKSWALFIIAGLGNTYLRVMGWITLCFDSSSVLANISPSFDHTNLYFFSSVPPTFLFHKAYIILLRKGVTSSKILAPVCVGVLFSWSFFLAKNILFRTLRLFILAMILGTFFCPPWAFVTEGLLGSVTVLMRCAILMSSLEMETPASLAISITICSTSSSSFCSTPIILILSLLEYWPILSTWLMRSCLSCSHFFLAVSNSSWS